MIILDTHIWVWWTHECDRLSSSQSAVITEHETGVIGISAISCWEISKLAEYGKIELPYHLEQWFDRALSYPGVL